MKKLPNKTPRSFSSTFPGTPSNALDALSKMLQIHPDRRISVQSALEHSFFVTLHNPQDEPVSRSTFDFSFENGPQKLNRPTLRQLIWKEVASFRPSCLPIAEPSTMQSSSRAINSNSGHPEVSSLQYQPPPTTNPQRQHMTALNPNRRAADT